MEYLEAYKKEALGLEISEHAIKLIHLISQAKQTTLQQRIYITLPQYTEENKSHIMIEGIKKAVFKLHTSCQRVNTALSDHLCLSQCFEVDTNHANWEAISLQIAEASLLHPLDTLYFDFQKSKHPDRSNQVLGVFCKQDTLNEQLTWITKNGLKTQAIELKSHALERAFQYLYRLHQYPRCWISVLVEPKQYIVLLWHAQHVLSSITDTIEVTHPEHLATTLYSQILYVLSQQPIDYAVQAVWIVGDTSDIGEIEQKCRSLLGLKHHPDHQYQSHGLKNNSDNMKNTLIALGLALRSI